MQDYSEENSRSPFLDSSKEAEKMTSLSATGNGINEGASSSNSGSYTNQSYQAESRNDSKLDDFFDSYISNVNSTEDPKAQSVCSDSVSRFAGDSRMPKQQNGFDQHVNIAVGSNNQHQIPESWFQQLQSDSSSLATLVTEKKISDSRRTFCLLVTFDLILTTLLWLIMCGTAAGSDKNFFDIVKLQIKDYTLYHSMFDVVCLAAVRFVFLEISYALVWIRHWWPVAVSTSITDILLILKIFPIFQSSGDEEYLKQALPMTIVILLTNFILSWIEVWFIDFKVLPAETKLAQRAVRQFIQSQNQQSYGTNDASERTPLLSARGGGRGRFTPPASSFYTGVTSDKLSYHSVLDSEFESPAGDHRRGNVFPARVSPEEMVYVEKGQTALNQLWALFGSTDVWKLDKELDNGDRLYTANLPVYGKTFRIDTVVTGITAQQIFHEIILKAEVMPSWNTSVDDVKILRRIGEQTAISLEVSKPAAKGLIQSRDFVTIRRVDKIGESYISAGISTDYPIPETGRIRGVNGPTGFIVTPRKEAFSSCEFTWILNTNLKGSLPQYLVNSNLAATLINFVKSMKRHLGVAED